jgi:CHAT domain-containing protein
MLAFLYSGVESTVSTLWPFNDRDAALYTRFFYQDIDRFLKEGRNKRVNLARANQAAY